MLNTHIKIRGVKIKEFQINEYDICCHIPIQSNFGRYNEVLLIDIWQSVIKNIIILIKYK